MSVFLMFGQKKCPKAQKKEYLKKEEETGHLDQP